MTDTVRRVTVTDEALAMLRKIEAMHGPLMFHQSGGCCDGSAPMCYPRHEARRMSTSAKSAAIRSTWAASSSSTGRTRI